MAGSHGSGVGQRRRQIGRRREPSEGDLAVRAAAGESLAFEQIFTRHHARLLAYCRHSLGDPVDAEDALQQTFVAAYRSLRANGAPEELRPWLYAIARNCCRDLHSARGPVLMPDPEPSLAGLGDPVVEREDLRELLDDVARLPEEQRTALLLSTLEDLPYRSIAGVLECPEPKVRALIYQARSNLLAERGAREASCESIRLQVAVARGGELRRGPLRRHLRRCPGCREFAAAVGGQRSALALALPVLPAAYLFDKVLGNTTAADAASAPAGGGAPGSGAATGGSAGTTAGGGAAVGHVTGSGAGALFGGGIGAKLAAVAAVAAVSVAAAAGVGAGFGGGSTGSHPATTPSGAPHASRTAATSPARPTITGGPAAAWRGATRAPDAAGPRSARPARSDRPGRRARPRARPHPDTARGERVVGRSSRRRSPAERHGPRPGAASTTADATARASSGRGSSARRPHVTAQGAAAATATGHRPTRRTESVPPRTRPEEVQEPGAGTQASPTVTPEPTSGGEASPSPGASPSEPEATAAETDKTIVGPGVERPGRR